MNEVSAEPEPLELERALAAACAIYEGGDAAGASAAFAAILARHPDQPDALRLRGLSLVRAGDAPGALPWLARARQLARNNPLTHLHYGIGLLEADRPVRAAAVLRRAIGMMPGDPAPWLNFSAALLALGEPRAARAAARRALAIAPRLAAAHYALGLAERDACDMVGARRAFAAATRFDPALAEAWLGLGLACLQLGEIVPATRAMERALAVRPGFAAAEVNLAGLLLVQGEQEETLRRLRAVLDRDPNCVPARLNLANALLLDRESAAALQVLEGAAPPAREGAHWRAHRAMSLLLLHRDAEAAAELDSITNPYDADILIAWRRLVLAERAGDETSALAHAARLATLAADEGAALFEHRIIGHFDLAIFRNQRDEIDEAFRHWTAGHALLQRAQPFSRKSFATFVDASQAEYDFERLRGGPRAAVQDETPVFIVGLPRSGTTLCEQILAAHPRVCAAGERPDLHRTVLRLAGPALEPGTLHRLAALDEPALTAAAKRYVADLRGLDAAAQRITDKMPGNALHLGFLATLLPGARVIRCRRDPRDIGLSIFQLRFFGYHPYAHDLGDLGWYIGQHERLMAHWGEVLPIPMLDLDLIDWIDDFRGTLARVLDFVGLPYESACERFHEQRRRVRTASAEQVRQPVNARGVGRWRRYQAQLAPMLAELAAAGLPADEAPAGGWTK